MNSLPLPSALLTSMRAAVSLDDALDQAEAEAGALDLRRDRVGRAIERFEDVRLIGGRDADAAIRDGHAHFGPAAPARAIPIHLPRRRT